jgi:hypothetical protein
MTQVSKEEKKIKKGLLKKLIEGEICIDFINCCGSDCNLLRNLLAVAAPKAHKNPDELAYSFDNYYYIDGDEWFASSWRRCEPVRIRDFYFKKEN